MRFRVFTLLFVFVLVGCESKEHKVAALQAQYNAAYAAYTKDCPDNSTSGAARMLTGEKLTPEQMADLEAKKESPGCKVQAAVQSPRRDSAADSCGATVVGAL